MKLQKQFLVNFLNEQVVPFSAWSIKYYYDNILCYVIKNENYCQVFWIYLWYHYLADKFKQQNMINVVENGDLTLPVIITQDLSLLNAPQIIQNIDYYADKRVTNTHYKTNMSLNTILAIVVVLFLVTITLTLMFFKRSIYTALI